MVTETYDRRKMLIRDYWIGAGCVLLNYTALFFLKELIGQPIMLAATGTAAEGTYVTPAARSAASGQPPYLVHPIPTAAAITPRDA